MQAAQPRVIPSQTAMPPRRLMAIAVLAALAAGCVAAVNPQPLQFEQQEAPPNSFRG